MSQKFCNILGNVRCSRCILQPTGPGEVERIRINYFKGEWEEVKLKLSKQLMVFRIMVDISF